MIVLYSYPGLFGLPDNNPFGLKVHAFLRLSGLPFRQEHVFDASRAPRGQLPYIDDDGTIVGDSDTIIAHLTRRHGLVVDRGLTDAERAIDHLVSRMLDDLYWVMSYSRWADDRFWPQFRDAVLEEHPEVTPGAMEAAREYNLKRYHYQGIGRFEVEAVYGRGIADLRTLHHLVGDQPFMHGDRPHSVDAAAYGFLANMLFYPIETPLKDHAVRETGLQGYCRRVHERVERSPGFLPR
jgi:glutathione S-transferase